MKKINWKTAMAILFGSVLFISCGSTAHIEKDETVNFRNYKTFAWLHGEDRKLEKQSALAETKIKSAVSAELMKSGWREVKVKPDVILDYDILVERGSKRNQEPVYTQPFTRVIYNPYSRRYATIYYPSQFLGYESYDELVKEGTITITMIDAKTDKEIWQGWTTDEVNSKNLTGREIQNAVHSIFKKFDVAKN